MKAQMDAGEFLKKLKKLSTTKLSRLSSERNSFRSSGSPSPSPSSPKHRDRVVCFTQGNEREKEKEKEINLYNSFSNAISKNVKKGIERKLTDNFEKKRTSSKNLFDRPNQSQTNLRSVSKLMIEKSLCHAMLHEERLDAESGYSFVYLTSVYHDNVPELKRLLKTQFHKMAGYDIPLDEYLAGKDRDFEDEFKYLNFEKEEDSDEE